jgi:acetolactate synthase-1/2/3 large subunit
MVIIILNNDNYGMVKWKQKNEHFTDYALDFNNPDFKKLAESFGATGYTVEKKEDFKMTLEAAIAGK